MNLLLLLAIIEEDRQKNGEESILYVDSCLDCEPSKFEDWLYSHKIINAIFPWVVGLLIGAAPIIISKIVLHFLGCG